MPTPETGRPQPPVRRGGGLAKLLLALLLLCVAPVVAGGSVGLNAWQSLHRPRQHDLPVVFELAVGVGLRTTAKRLEAAGLIDSRWSFEGLARWRGVTGKLKAGSYRFAGAVSPAQVLEALVAGVPGGDLAVTLPEGLNRWEITARLEAGRVCPGKEFLAAAGPELEGRLFPDTYRFFPKTPPAAVVAELLSRHDTVWGELRRKYPTLPTAAGTLGLDDRSLLILASLVEKEAARADERPTIAQVFYNRLVAGWKLQSDPTCVYGETTWQETPSPARCHDPANPYSTYEIRGLPPGPIANPGRSSLEAVLAPATDAGQLFFFVARRDGTGRHDFSATAEEHEEKVRRYLGKGR